MYAEVREKQRLTIFFSSKFRFLRIVVSADTFDGSVQTMSNPEALVYVQVGAKRWAVNNCDKEITVERAMEIVCREWCFEKAQVHIQEPAYYESTDWNYIRFRCGPLHWVMQNGELEQQYN